MVNLKIRDFVLNDIDAVLFDKDGTIIDAHTWWCEIIRQRAWAIIHTYNLDFSEVRPIMHAMGWMENNRLSPSGPVGLVGRKEVIWAVRKHMQLNYEIMVTQQELEVIFNQVHKTFKDNCGHYIKMLPGVYDFLSTLYVRGVHMAIVTNDTVEATRFILQQLGISQYFPTIIGHETSRAAKDTGIPANQAMSLMGVMPENTIVIGDAPIDMKMAIAANAACGIAVTTGQTPRNELERITPYVITDMSEIIIEKEDPHVSRFPRK